jgi:hypothetical protein
MFTVNETNVSLKGLADRLREEITKKAADKDVQLIIIDGLSSIQDEKSVGEVFAAPENAMGLKELAKQLDVAILVICHTKSDCEKHIRNTAPFTRGGLKIPSNMDGYFCHSLLVDPATNDNPGADTIYKERVFYMRFVDKRGAGMMVNKIIEIGENIAVNITDIDPLSVEIKINKR